MAQLFFELKMGGTRYDCSTTLAHTRLVEGLLQLYDCSNISAVARVRIRLDWMVIRSGCSQMRTIICVHVELNIYWLFGSKDTHRFSG